MSVLPGYTPGLHVIGECDVIAPHIELPLPESEHSTEHVPSMDPYPHVHVEAGRLADETGSIIIVGESFTTRLSSIRHWSSRISFTLSSYSNNIFKKNILKYFLVPNNMTSIVLATPSHHYTFNYKRDKNAIVIVI